MRQMATDQNYEDYEMLIWKSGIYDIKYFIKFSRM
jgi:hypothetical protein